MTLKGRMSLVMATSVESPCDVLIHLIHANRTSIIRAKEMKESGAKSSSKELLLKPAIV